MITAHVPTEETELTITCAHAGGRSTVRVAGELDAYTSIRLRGVLDDCLRPAATSISCNLAGVTFIDSGGLGLLVSARRRAHAAHIVFVVEDPSPSVRRLFETTGVTNRLLA